MDIYHSPVFFANYCTFICDSLLLYVIASYVPQKIVMMDSSGLHFLLAYNISDIHEPDLASHLN